MFSSIGRKGKGVFGILRMFGNDFSIYDKGECSFVAVNHLSLELVGILRLFVFTFILTLWIIEIEGKIPFEFEDRVIHTTIQSQEDIGTFLVPWSHIAFCQPSQCMRRYIEFVAQDG